MKKRLVFLVVVVALMGLSSLGISATEDVKGKMAPYQAAIDELNEEYPEAGVVLEDSALEEVYGNIVKRNLSPEEFKDETLRDWLEMRDWLVTVQFPETVVPFARSMPVLDEANKVEFSVTAAVDEGLGASPFDRLKSIRETITQVRYFAYGTFYLQAQVFSLTGMPGTFSYSSSSVTAGNYISITQSHFRVSQAPTAYLTNNSRNCVVTYVGYMHSASGLRLAPMLSYTITYSAG